MLGRKVRGSANPAGAVPSVLGKQRMQTAEKLVNFHDIIWGRGVGLRSPGDGDSRHIVV